jgi:glycosyltransferase involved in cell wall biosynthesis
VDSKDMVAATVLMPTHNHVETLRYSVASVLAQSLKDFELFVVGDGATPATRAMAMELQKTDKRIRFFDLPKGPRKGEVNRHAALSEASGRFVAYIGDDDLWMPHHLQTMDRLLTEVDFAHTLHVGVNENGILFVFAADLENPLFRQRMLDRFFNRFDFTFAGHTLAAYRRLPYGWRTTPDHFPWVDLYMWRQFLAEPWCRARSSMIPTGICTQSHLRPQLSDQERAKDLAHWQAAIKAPGFREGLWRLTAHTFARTLVDLEMQAADAQGNGGADAMR